MAKGRQQYFADEVSIQKEAREFAIEEQLKAKIDSVEEGAQVNVIETVKVNGDPLIPDAEKAVDVSVPLVEDTLYSVDTEAALSARQGKVLYDYILNLQSRGRYLSNWNCATGLPTTNPYDSPYEYRAGDYYLVSNVSSGTNYRPDGSEYVTGVASTTVETEIVGVSDMYIYDGTTWQLIINSERPIAIDDALSPTSTNPVENRVVTQAIGTKQNIITDLQTIREGAAKGDTAVQPGDSLSTLSGDSDDIAEGSSHLFMTTSERTKLGNQSGVNTGDETQATIMAKLGAASATTNGYLTSTDWNTFNNKQDAISDLQTIRDNATAGKNASDTIATYGDIVTHNVNEFATAAQGAKADTALQSGDNVSELVNDAGYITDAYHDDTKQDKLTAGDNVTIGEVCHRNTQGPCPDGFHIPTRWYRDDGIGVSDIGTLKGYLSALGVSGENMQVVLKNPTGHNRWQPWRDTSHSVGSRPQITRRGNGVDRSVYSMNTPTAIRPFKNDPIVPDNSWTILFDGSSIAVGAGVFWSEGLGLISISADGVNWITLADKNLGAIQVYNQGDAFTAANTGNLYQWGNNFGRPYGTTPATTTEQVDASGYGPGNYYYREVQFTGDYWDSSVNSNLWGCPQRKGQIGTRCALTISANDTTYVASDFDIKDLADSTGKRAEWDAKQDALDLGANLSWGQDGKLNATDTTYTAGPGISISQNNVISNTRTSAEWGNIQGTLSNQTDLQNALDEKQGTLTAGDNITIDPVTNTISAQVPDSAQWGNITGTLSNQTDLQNALDGKVNLGDNKVYDNTVVEIGKWVHGEGADVSGHHITLDPNGEVSTYNVTVAGHNEATLGSGNLTLLENTALGGDETTVISQDGITVTEGQTTKTYDFLGDDRIATLSDVSGATSGAVSDASYDSTWDGVTTVAPSKNAVYDKIEADVNTKTFYLSNTSDLTTAQAAYDWYLAGKNPIIMYDNTTYILKSVSANRAEFRSLKTSLNTRSDGTSHSSVAYVDFILNNSTTVTSIADGYVSVSGPYIATDINYSNPYIPQYDGNPATKKYVDDSISAISITPAWGDITGTLADQTDLQAVLDAKQDNMVVLSYGNSTWNDFLTVYQNNAVVYCRASSNSDPSTGSQTRMAFMAYVNNQTNPTEVEFQYYRSVATHSDNTQGDEVFVYKLNSSTGWSVTKRNAYTKVAAGTGLSSNYSSGTITLSNNGVTSVNGNTGAITIPTYTAGTGLTLSNDEFAVDTTTIATKADLANFAGFQVVAQLPTTDIKTNIIYLLGPVGTGADKYEEYIYSNNAWIMIGDTTIDLSPYLNVNTQTSDAITEGSTNLFLTTAERTKLTNTSGTNTGDETKSTIQTKLGAASSSNSGYLTSSDWDTFNGKANAADVNTKIFYLSGISGTTALEEMQEAYDWLMSGNYAILYYDRDVYIPRDWSTGEVRWYDTKVKNDGMALYQQLIRVRIVDGDVAGITLRTTQESRIANVLPIDNTSSFTPTGDYQPATKKYVDDAVAGGGGYRPIFFAGSSLADIGAALANYLNTYSITPSNLSDVGPIGVWEDGPYYLQGTPVITTDAQYRFTFQSPTTQTTTRNNSYSWTNHPLRRFVMDWDSTNSVWSYNSSDTSYVQVTSYNYLRTDVNYATPYTPQYNGSPATKKYVDDTVAAGISSAITNETSGTQTSINKIRVGTEEEYQAITTYDEHTAYMTF